MTRMLKNAMVALDDMEGRLDRLAQNMPHDDSEMLAECTQDLIDKGLLWIGENEDGYGRWHAISPTDPRCKDGPKIGYLTEAEIANGLAALFNHMEGRIAQGVGDGGE